MENKEYKSPLKKLVKFFEQSRDIWKKKYIEKKKELKRVTNRIYDLEKRKEHWKERAMRAEEKVQQLNEDLKKISINPKAL
jgi:predicted  nucleic acid-binding Zn-ribbon protein